jgi:outer membrane protein
MPSVWAAATVDSVRVANRVARELDRVAETGGTRVRLDDLYEKVIAQNPAIQEARTGLERAAGERLILRSRALPRLTLGGTGGQIGEKGDSDSRLFLLMTGNFSQPLFDAGIPASWRRGNLAIPLAQHTYQNSVATTLHRSRLVYLQAVHARALLGIYPEVIRVLEKNIVLQEERVKVGLGSRSDVIRAEVQLRNRLPEKEAIQQVYRARLVELAQLSGLDLKDPSSVKIHPVGPLAFAPLPLKLVALNEEAQAHRPDVQLLEVIVEQSAEDIRLAAAGFYPQVRLVANGQLVPGDSFTDRQANVIRSGDDEENTEVLFGPTMSWAIWDGGATGGRKERAEAIRERNILQLQDLRDNIPRSLAVVEQRLRTSEEKIRVLGASVSLAERSLDIVVKSLEQGFSTQLELLQAQTSLFDTKAGLINALLEHATVAAEIDLITGRYLRFTDADTPPNPSR